MSTFADASSKLPDIGVGIGLRAKLKEAIFENRNVIDWLEVTPENYLGIGGRAREEILEAAAQFPLVSHGLSMSIGSFDELNWQYLTELKRFLHDTKCLWFSDHLAFVSLDGSYFYSFLPLPQTQHMVEHVVERAKRVQDFVGLPFLLENISYYMTLPGAEMSEAQFISEVIEKADCGLLLDVNNVFVNAVNHKYDAREFVKELPPERILQVHVAGHKSRSDFILDTHGEQVSEDVYALLEYLLERCEPKGICLERDTNYPENFSELLSDIERIGDITRGALQSLR